MSIYSKVKDFKVSGNKGEFMDIGQYYVRIDKCRTFRKGSGQLMAAVDGTIVAKGDSGNLNVGTEVVHLWDAEYPQIFFGNLRKYAAFNIGIDGNCDFYPNSEDFGEDAGQAVDWDKECESVFGDVDAEGKNIPGAQELKGAILLFNNSHAKDKNGAPKFLKDGVTPITKTNPVRLLTELEEVKEVLGDSYGRIKATLSPAYAE